MMKDLSELRKTLHKHPELSGNEFHTRTRIRDFLQNIQFDQEIELAGTGIAFVFDGKEKGPTLMFRSELDALPIPEKSESSWKSDIAGVSHACGHDGHMTILAGLAQKIALRKPQKGKVVFLFQPSEETGQGAEKVVLDPDFEPVQPDFIYALHNIPGVQKNKILIRKGTFASASKGVIIKLFGKTSHAGEPENGINPAKAIAKMIDTFYSLPKEDIFEEYILLTIIHLRLGEIAFGTSPGYAEIMLTLRSYQNKDMKVLCDKTEEYARKIALKENLGISIEYTEVFPATVNNDTCLKILEKAIEKCRLQKEYLPKPFSWSEDFSYFTEKYAGCLFGLGAGTEQAQLHNPDYDFPEDIIETALSLLYQIYLEHALS
jgi:amidohydrolase